MDGIAEPPGAAAAGEHVVDPPFVPLQKGGVQRAEPSSPPVF